MKFNFGSLWSLFIFARLCLAQSDTLGLGDGFVSFSTPNLSGQLVKDSQTLYSLRPINENSTFDFLPYDVMYKRAGNGNYHLGDLTFRVRTVGSTDWVQGDTSTDRQNVTALPVSGSTISAANLAPTLQNNSLLSVTRRWVVEDGQLELIFDVTNPQNTAVEIGAIGAPLEFNNIFYKRNLSNINQNCSLFDPYIGQDAGFVQVTPLLGTLPPLVVVPLPSSPLEGWRFLNESNSALAYQSQEFEGLYEWQFHTLAYAENEWAGVTPWNAPTSAILQPNQTRSYGLQFRLASSIRGIEDELMAAGRPVTFGVPGFIISSAQEAKLYLNYTSPIQSLSVSPAGALSFEGITDGDEGAVDGWYGYTIRGIAWGRSRLTIQYADNTTQTINYLVTTPFPENIATLGNFLTNEQWFVNASDPFRRSPSVITYDRSVNASVLNEYRAWIPGLSDESGAGSWLAATVKQYGQPNAAEVQKMEMYVSQTMWGSLQNYDWSVKDSVYFYQPSLVPNYTYPSDIKWTSTWNQNQSFTTTRAYNYVHVISAYWALYRVARNYPSLTTRPWLWYITQAVQTVGTMSDGQVGQIDNGLMEETVILFLLDDLKREGLTQNATFVEARMQARAELWSTEEFPYGSELSWDCTGQEGVYAWETYFNYTASAQRTLTSVLAYDPLIPHWGYNGNARRYWDFIVGGKLQRIERQIHHYGSGLNAIPLLSQFEADPTDYHLLRVGFAGISGSMTNIDQGGFASCAFHSFPQTLAWDAYSGDYGPNFVGHSLKMGVYLIQHPTFGWQAFGGDIESGGSSGPSVTVTPRDSLQKRIFIAPIAALIVLDAGVFTSFTYEPATATVHVSIAPTVNVAGAAAAPVGRLVVSQTAAIANKGVLRPVGNWTVDAGAYVIPFGQGGSEMVVTLV